MSDDGERLRRALNLSVRLTYTEIALLNARACDPKIAREKQPEAVLWSWVHLTGAWTGTIALVQPLDLAVLVTKQSRDNVSEPIETDILMSVQQQITEKVVAKTVDQYFPETKKPIISTVHVGNGAPDVRTGDWFGQTWAIGGWWMAIFVHDGALADAPVPAEKPQEEELAPELVPDTERVTNAMPLTKVLRAKDADGPEVEWPEMVQKKPLTASAVSAQRRATPIPEPTPVVKPPVTRSDSKSSQFRSVPNTSNPPGTQTSHTSGRRSVVRTIRGLVDPNAAKDLSNQAISGVVPVLPPREESDPAERTQPWYKAKRDDVTQGVQLEIPKELGHYKILGLLGEGGMGMVLKGQHMTLNRKAAIKLMKPRLASDKNFAERFMHEARIAASLEHPNLVNIYDAAQENGQLYMALRYMGGGDLTEQLKREGPLSEPRAIHMFTALLSALHYINTKHLVHRDIKPGNVLLDSDYSPRLGDLGLARKRHAAGDPDSDRMGTPAYMSPEQLTGEGDLDIRSDIYSLGLTLYVALTCHQPLQGKDLSETIRNVLKMEVPDPRTYVKGISEAMTQVVRKAMAKRPQDRFRTPLEFQEALSSVEYESLNELSASGVSWFGKIFGGRK